MSYSGSEIDAVFTADNGFDDNTLCTLLSRAAASELGRKCLKDSFVNAGGTVITVRVVIEVAFRSEKMASESYVYDRLRDCHTNEEQCGRKAVDTDTAGTLHILFDSYLYWGLCHSRLC